MSPNQFELESVRDSDERRNKGKGKALRCRKHIQLCPPAHPIFHLEARAASRPGRQPGSQVASQQERDKPAAAAAATISSRAVFDLLIRIVGQRERGRPLLALADGRRRRFKYPEEVWPLCAT